MKVTRVRHNWYESDGFKIDRPHGMPYDLSMHTFLHFLSPFEFLYEGEIITIPKYAFILFDETTPQWFMSPQASRHDWLHATGDIQDVYESVGLSTNHLYHLTDGVFVTQLIFEIEMEFNGSRYLNTSMCDLKVRELFIQLARNVQSGTSHPTINQATADDLLKLRSIISESYNQPWNVADMASIIHLSPSYLHKVYSRFFGLPPYQDLVMMRIEHAKIFLCESSFSVSKIATDVGYNNVHHFIRQFKEVVGISPGQYKKMHKLK